MSNKRTQVLDFLLSTRAFAEFFLADLIRAAEFNAQHEIPQEGDIPEELVTKFLSRGDATQSLLELLFVRSPKQENLLMEVLVRLSRKRLIIFSKNGYWRLSSQEEGKRE